MVRWLPAWSALASALLLSGCLDLGSRAQRDRWTSIRETPPRPAPALHIAEPPATMLALADVKPALPAQPVASTDVPVRASFVTTVSPQAHSGVNSVSPEAHSGVNSVRDLYQTAATKWASMDSYICRFRRREVVGLTAQPEDLMLLKFRKQPFSVYLKWLGPHAKGREVMYVKGQHGGMIHTLTAAGDGFALTPAGLRLQKAPDDPMVKARCRYPITETGFGTMIERFGTLVAESERGQASLVLGGSVRRPEFERPMIEVVQKVAPRAETLMPGGGERRWYFDPVLHMPLLVVAKDHAEREVEYYCYDRVEYPVRLDDEDFNPEKLGKHPS